jgi:DNA processing protein
MKAALQIMPLKRGMEITPWVAADPREQLCFIALSLVEFLSPLEKLHLVTGLERPSRLFELPLGEVARLAGRRLLTKQWLPAALLESAERIRVRLTEDGTRSIFYGDLHYPPLLGEITDPPLALFVRGSLPQPGTTVAGIVGTRFPTGACREAAFRLGFELGRNGIVVVSGLARGIDREAHEGCEAAGGCSVAVLGNGIDMIYPPSSRDAAHALLARGGAIVSEYPPGVPPLRWHFPARNRIISGMSRGVVVVQAPERSGALFTAEYAAEQGRDLWVHSAGCVGSTGAGTRHLAELGAPAIHGAQAIFRDWGIVPVTPRPRVPPRGGSEGARMAALVEEEIGGACTRRAGEAYWRT